MEPLKPEQEREPTPPEGGGALVLLSAPVEARSIDEEFALWWAVYPRHHERAAARKKFAIVRRTVSFEALVAGARRYRDDPNREDRFTKHPAVWLNKGCWDDEPLPPRRSERDAQAARAPDLARQAMAMRDDPRLAAFRQGGASPLGAAPPPPAVGSG